VVVVVTMMVTPITAEADPRRHGHPQARPTLDVSSPATGGAGGIGCRSSLVTWRQKSKKWKEGRKAGGTAPPPHATAPHPDG